MGERRRGGGSGGLGVGGPGVVAVVCGASPRKNGAVRVGAVPGGGGPGWGRSAVGLVRVGAVQVGAVRVGAKISRFFFLSRLFFLGLFRFFSWTCVGGLGVLISQNCAKHTSLEFSGLLVMCFAGGRAEEGLAEEGLGQGVGGKVDEGRGVQGRAVRGRRVQGWGVQGRCYQLKNVASDNKIGLKRHLVWP